jgi:hypothetical protein
MNKRKNELNEMIRAFLLLLTDTLKKTNIECLFDLPIRGSTMTPDERTGNDTTRRLPKWKVMLKVCMIGYVRSDRTSKNGSKRF